MIYAALSDIGNKRHTNEDSYLVNEEKGLFIVADGMGGHNAGEVASLEACRIIESYILNAPSDAEEVLRKAVEKANREIFIRASEEEEKRGMGTTSEVCLVKGDTLFVAHVGDSRVYILSENEMRKITKDHSIVGMMVDTGSISEEEARNHPQRNLITRAVGTGMSIEVDIIEETLHKNDKVLICTDGLTNMVSRDEVFEIVKNSPNVNEAVKTLVDKAKENGGDDNITVVIFGTADCEVDNL